MFHHLNPGLKIHFVGIGGIGMSGIAEVLLTLGYEVSGTDLQASENTRRLESLGAKIQIGHSIDGLTLLGEIATVVVISSAVNAQNPEVVEAKRVGIPVIPRAEMLAELMRLKYGIAIAGSHGKTTTTSLTATVLKEAGLDPTAIIGGRLPQLKSNARLGKSEYLVAEADESDGSFLHLNPSIAVVTNIDPEHLDHYGTLASLKETFLQFINKVPFYGLAVLCLENEHVQNLLPKVQKRFVTYGFSPLSDYRATELQFLGTTTRFLAWSHGKLRGPVEIHMPGEHNVLNALATLAVSDFLQISFEVYQKALVGFQGVGRRFTVRGEKNKIMVVDDYGHHPTEIRATLEGARRGFGERRLVVLFQPHRYTRTRDLMSEFSRAFNNADMVVITDIYSAGENPIFGVTAEKLSQLIREHGHRNVRYIPKLTEVVSELKPLLRKNDLVITLGAGDIWKIGEELLTVL